MKHIFITGGVVSSLGKGLTMAALGALLEQRGLSMRLQKFDPYLNVDPGTMNPFQHGEVYVLDDGAETDLDLGHYERFTSAKLDRSNNLTSGQLYERLISRERRGDFLGETVQVIPHLTNEIKDQLRRHKESIDIVITEVGGTVGDIEGLPFLEAMRQFALEEGPENVMFIHVTLVPYLKASGELKTKPSQQSVAKLREIGISPDILICRTERPLSMELRQKLSLFCSIPSKAVIEKCDVEHSIYEVPLMLEKEKLDELVIQKFQMRHKTKIRDDWENVVNRLKHPKFTVKIGVVGKYIELQDAYKSVYEALTHGGIANHCKVIAHRIDPEILEKKSSEERRKYFTHLDGVLIPGGFGERGVEGKILAAQLAREESIPYLGLCLGMQIAVIEFARNVAGLKKANSQEFDIHTSEPVIHLMEEQKGQNYKGATMRLGAYFCQLEPSTHTSLAYQPHTKISERHRHRFEFNNAYRSQLENAGLRIAGINPEKQLVEVIEIPDHPWYIGVQFHPEFQSKPNKAHPLFAHFIKASLKHIEQKQMWAKKEEHISTATV